MNPDINVKRGCFIRENKSEDNTTYTVVDYPTWTVKNHGIFTAHQNEAIPDGQPFETEFADRAGAVDFCTKENYVICAAPGSKPLDLPKVEDYED